MIKHASQDEIAPLRESIDAGRKAADHVRTQKPNPASSIPRPGFAHNSSASIASLSSSTATSLSGLSPSSSSAPRFGSAAACPGCRIRVSPMEPGIVPGPGATKWHAPCLVCGGKQLASKRASASWVTRDDVKGPGCGKKLDSAAKGDIAEGILWCRDCFDMTKSMSSPVLPSSPTTGIFPTSTSLSRPGSAHGMSSASLGRQITRGSGATSPLRRQFQIPTPTTGSIPESGVPNDQDEEADTIRPLSSAGHYLPGRSPSPLKMHYTGMTRSASPVVRQYTGTSSGPIAEEAEPLAIQFTGGGVPITRQLTSASGSRRPRSALGMRSMGSKKSVDEGRGMFLVRQLTGQGQVQRSETAKGSAEAQVSPLPI